MQIHHFGGDSQGESGEYSVRDFTRDMRNSHRLNRTIKRADSGDIVQIHSGEYSLVASDFTDICIQGSSRADTILNVDPVTFRGSSKLAHCSIRYVRYKKAFRAISVESAGSLLVIQDVAIGPISGDKTTDLAGKAISALANRSEVPDIRVGPGATLWVDNSTLGAVAVDGGLLCYTPTARFTRVNCINGGQTSPVAALEQESSAARNPNLQRENNAGSPSQHADAKLNSKASEPAEPSRGDSSPFWSKLKKKSTERGESKQGHHIPPTNEFVEEPTGIGPNPHGIQRQLQGHVIEWHVIDSANWDGAILPNLEVGTTVILDEGEFWLPGTPFNDVTFIGRGDPNKIIINIVDGSLSTGAGRTLSILNLTLRPAFGEPAIEMFEGRALELSNVIVDHLRTSTVESPVIQSIALFSGNAYIENCKVRGSTHIISGGIFVAGGADLKAVNSELGRVVCAQASAEIVSCALYSVGATNDGVIKAAGNLWLKNTNAFERAQVFAKTGGVFVATQVISKYAVTNLVAEDRSTLEISMLQVPQTGKAIVNAGENASIDVKGDQEQIEINGIDRYEPVESIEELLEELDGMVGLDPVKAWVHGLRKRVQFDSMESQDSGSSNYHMVFYGSPGTGKTSVARLIGKLLYRLGVLPTTNYVEVDRSRVVGRYIGHTEENTRELVEKSMGGVLFVDEAYQLVRESSPNDFGQEAIDTLLAALENRRGEFVTIFAGYTEPMDSFLDANPGLRSRLRDKNRIEFPDYSPEEVGRITANILSSDKWLIDYRLTVELAARAYSKLRNDERGNGRSARNFSEAIIETQKEFVVDRGVDMEQRRFIRPETIEFALGLR